MTTKPELNKVDKLVAELMINYPLSYETRAKALFGIFFSNSYYWTKDGCLTHSYQKQKCFEGAIDTSDLDQADAAWNKDEEFDIAIRLRNELERRTRLFKAENIEYFATMNDDKKYEYYDISKWNLDSQYNVIARVPFGSIDADWLNAAEEIISNLLITFNYVYSLHYDNPLKSETAPEPSMFSRMPEDLQRNYTFLKTIEDKLEAQSGKKARMAEFWQSHGKAILDEVIAEGK